MGHIASKNVYTRLCEHLDSHAVGAQGRTTIDGILKITHTPDEAELAVQLLLKPTSLPPSRRLNRPEHTLKVRLEAMADESQLSSNGVEHLTLLDTIPGIGNRTPIHGRSHV